MGMDVFGQNPREKAGEYFRANVWTWGPLWSYCCAVAPELTGKVKYGYSNDGDGLNEQDSLTLSISLKTSLENGFYEQYSNFQKEFPSVTPTENMGLQLVRTLTGKSADHTSEAPEKERVLRFAQFLEHCGGFEIC